MRTGQDLEKRQAAMKHRLTYGGNYHARKVTAEDIDLCRNIEPGVSVAAVARMLRCSESLVRYYRNGGFKRDPEV